MEAELDVDATRSRIRRLANALRELSDNEELFGEFMDAAIRDDASHLRKIIRALSPENPLEREDCLGLALVSIPVRLPKLESVCRWMCGDRAGEIVNRASVRLPNGREVTLTPEMRGILEDLGVIRCGIELSGYRREWVTILQAVCDPDY